MRAITIEKGKIFEAWARAGKMDRLDPTHVFILLWGSTQFYADFDAMVESMLNTGRLTREQFNVATETIVHIVLKGCGVRSGARPSAGRPNSHGSRASRSVRSA
jgi:TetR/AcrR family transcriptional regulator